MASKENNFIDRLFLTDEKASEIDDRLSVRKVGEQIVNGKEPLIDIVDKSSSEIRDPLQTCSEMKSDDSKKLKILPQLPLKNMVYEALEAMPSSRGNRTFDIKRFIIKNYGIDFGTAKIIKVLKTGLENGEISQIKRTNTKQLLARYRLSKFNYPRAIRDTKKARWLKSIENCATFDAAKEVDGKNTPESKFDASMKKRSGKLAAVQIIHSRTLVSQDNVKAELDTFPVNGEPVNVSDPKSMVQKTEGDTIHTDEIDFMVSHSLHSSPNPNGMRLDEITGFIHSFYCNDEQESLPHVEKCLNNSIEKEVLLKNGDRYDNTSSTCNSKSKINLQKEVNVNASNCAMNESLGVSDELENCTSSCSEDVFFPEVKLELEEMANFLVSNHDGMEMNENNNVIQWIDEKQGIRQKHDAKRNAIPSLGNILASKTMKIELPRNSFQRYEIPSCRAKMKRLDDSKAVLSEFVKLEEGIESEHSKEPFSSFMPCKVILLSSESMKAQVDKQRRDSKLMEKLSVLFHTLKYNEYTLNDLRCQELDVFQMQETSRCNNLTMEPSPGIDERSAPVALAIADTLASAPHKYTITSGSNRAQDNKSKFKLQGDFVEQRYTVAEISKYVSRHPDNKLFPNNPAMLMRDLSWKWVGLLNNVQSLNLVGIGISRDEDLDCNVCGSELNFGPLNCEVCSSEQENIIEKCNICHFLCNRRDVFRKHFLWEHKRSSKKFNYSSESISEKNIGELLYKLANNNTYQCNLCTFSTNNIKMFESHIVGYHTLIVNAFPPLPDIPIHGKVLISENEITNTCCHKCNECGFISNRRDLMVYHILDVHLSMKNDFYDNRFSGMIDEPIRKSSGKRRRSLCDICGKFYSNVTQHSEIHVPKSILPQLNVNGTKSIREYSLDMKEQSLTLSDEISKRFRSPKRRKSHGRLLCHICGKILNRTLYEHLRMHNQVMFDCTICGRQFNRRCNLLTHRRVHTREKPFQCDICKMMFGYKCSVKGHIVNVHSETVA